jgi:hypothetical protein
MLKEALDWVRCSNYWDGYSNPRTKAGDTHSLSSVTVPFDGTFMFRIMAKDGDVLCEHKYEWKEDIEHNSHPRLRQL